ncbi:MAG TPA: suppressor of fused domain protein [Mycobacteriales bacterium]|nr:suppressor of fused domain protein [Mycobacteriales bacterium]
MDDVLAVVEAHLVSSLGTVSSRASVTFLGMEPIEVLRFGPSPEQATCYLTLGMSRHPLPDPTSPVLEPVTGPRAELVLSLRGVHDSVLRPVAVLAAAPSVEGIRPSAGSSYDLGQPLCDRATVTAVLLGEPDGLVPDLPLPDADDGSPRGPVRFFPLLPMTAVEAEWKRAHDAAALEERWLTSGADLRDPYRLGVTLS